MQIPADMVINCVITAIFIHSNQAPKNFIYHVSSSLRNPLKLSDVWNISHHYFMKTPYINQNGKPIVISKGIVVNSFVAFNIYMIVRYVLLLMVCCTNIIALFFFFYYHIHIIAWQQPNHSSNCLLFILINHIYMFETFSRS